MRGRRATALTVLLLGACSGKQSAMAPSGPNAEAILDIGWIMLWGGTAIFAVVMALTLYVLFRDSNRPWRLGNRSLIVGGGVVFPILALTVLLAYTVKIGGELAAHEPEALRVEVTGKMWWWDVLYPGDSDVYAGSPDVPGFSTANEIRIPVDRPIELVLTSDNVIHSFWIPSIAGKIDMIPGHVNRKVIEASAPGAYRGQCAEFCGVQHAWMAFDLIAMEPDAFDAWLRKQREPARVPELPLLIRGQKLFLSTGCGACHRVRGLEGANGVIGPDLTHVGARTSLAGGMFPNTVGAFAGWIASAQHLKPGNGMPSFDVLTGVELRALSAYLESLE